MKHILTTISQIKEAVDKGYTVYCDSLAYEVIKDSDGDYTIKCEFNGFLSGLHGKAGTKYENKLNGKLFFYNTK